MVLEPALMLRPLTPDVPALFNGYAGSIGLDVERLKKDLVNPEVAARVDADQKLGASRGVTSTPTLLSLLASFMHVAMVSLEDSRPRTTSTSFITFAGLK